jgi:hypothetical protein
VDVGPDPLEAAQQLGVVVERQIRMQAVDDVQLRERLIGAPPQLVPRLLEGHRVRARHSGLQARERAEQAARHAHVRRLDAEVVVEIRVRAVPLLTLAVGEPPDSEQVLALEQAYAVLQTEALPSLKPGVDIQESGARDPSTNHSKIQDLV